MPFQALAFANRIATGTPVSKLVWLRLVEKAHLDCYAEIDRADLSAFAHASREEVDDALRHLRSLNLISWMAGPIDSDCLVHLPTTQEPLGERRRPKLSPDQLRAIETDRCPGCLRQQSDEAAAAEPDHYFAGSFHVDHIIPRSIGGADTEANLWMLCPRCNSRKGHRAGWVSFL